MLNEEAVKKAKHWYVLHKLHVDRLIKGQKRSVEPSGFDRFRPELWKACHWLAFKESGEI